MAFRIGLVISLALAVYGAIGTANDINTTYFVEPGRGIVVINYLLCAVGTLASAYFIGRMAGYEGNSYMVLFILPILVMIALIISATVMSKWMETEDIEENGTVVNTTIDSTSFKWVKSGREQLYYSFSYRFHLNDSIYQFKQWRRITNHNFTSKRNPKVGYDMLPNHNLLHPGDTLEFMISKLHPWRHRLLTRREGDR
jgi:ABC-type transport system involved in multi-copper enzyme maturation permease subunit